MKERTHISLEPGMVSRAHQFDIDISKICRAALSKAIRRAETGRFIRLAAIGVASEDETTENDFSTELHER
jgi:hypothetical protein